MCGYENSSNSNKYSSVLSSVEYEIYNYSHNDTSLWNKSTQITCAICSYVIIMISISIITSTLLPNKYDSNNDIADDKHWCEKTCV